MIYLLFGSDGFRIHKRFQEIVARARAVHGTNLAHVQIDADEQPIETAAKDFESPSLFAPTRLIVLKNIQGTKDAAALERLVDRFSLDTSAAAIVVVVAGPLEDKDAVRQLCQQKGRLQEFPLLSNAHLARWVRDYFAAHDMEIDVDALEYIVGGIGPDLWRMDNECKKLALWYGYKKNTRVRIADIRRLVRFEETAGVPFPFLDGISARSQKQSVAELERMLISGGDESALLFMAIRQCEQMAQLFGLTQEGRLPADTAKKIGAHPYVVNKLYAQLKKWSHADLERALKKCAQYDVATKTGACDVRLAATLLAVGV